MTVLIEDSGLSQFHLAENDMRSLRERKGEGLNLHTFDVLIFGNIVPHNQEALMPWRWNCIV